MKYEIDYVKYSIFENFEFLEATSDNVSKTYNIFGKYDFLPNTIQMIQIRHPQNAIKVISRPQFINNDMKCNIVFLPERIDIEFKTGKNNEKAMQYYEEILNVFHLEANRIALNCGIKIKCETEEEIAKVREFFTKKELYPFEDNVFEWSSRNVTRRECKEINELVNICQEVTYFAGSNEIIFDTDINTLNEITNKRFNISHLKSFFTQADIWDNDIVENIKGMI